ncbi:MAG: hypothetical protein Q4G07_02280 [Oscillospiraceae bacterium]|nr:hypothetical protein [Oscillospiraceae bacterium]
MKKARRSLLPAFTAVILIAISASYLIFAARLPQQLSQQSAILAGEIIDLSNAACPELAGQQKALEKARVYLLGEVHGVQGNTAVASRYLTYLVRDYGVRYLLLETGPATAGLLDLYLETGDEALLKDIFAGFEGSFAYTEEYFEMIHTVKALSDTLPPDDRLHFIGLDQEQQPLLLGRYLSLLLPGPETPVPEHIEPLLTKLREDKSACRDRAFVQELGSSLKVCPDDYAAYLGGRHAAFSAAVENTLSQTPRDTLFLENFKAAAQQLPEGKFFGQIGLAHLTGARQAEASFAAQLEEITSVFTLELRYIGCSYLHPLHGATLLVDLEPPVIYEPKGSFRFYSPEEGETLIERLNARSVTGDCLILIENAPAAKPFSASG